jgi:hypothetical protein
MFDTRAAKMALAIAVASVVIAVAVAPLATSAAYAVKTVTPPDCIGDPQEREECPGESGGQNPNREQQECEVTGGGGQIVQGQQKKVC